MSSALGLAVACLIKWILPIGSAAATTYYCYFHYITGNGGRATKVRESNTTTTTTRATTANAPSSLKTARRGRRASSVPKKLYFRIENNVFYDPVNEKQSHLFRPIKSIGKCDEDRAESRRSGSRLKFFFTFRNAADLDIMVELAASDPILTARHLSDDGTARLASWTTTDKTVILPNSKPKKIPQRMPTRKPLRKHAIAKISRSEAASRTSSKDSLKRDSIETPKSSPKPRFDFHVDLYRPRSDITTPKFAQTPVVSLNTRLRSSKTTPSTDNHRESCEDITSEFALLDMPRNPFESVTINIPVLGFWRCGKTSLLNSLMQVGPTRSSSPSKGFPTYYYPMVVFNYQVFNFRLIDCPMMLQDFPLSTLEAWTDFRGWGLRMADFFILVFDITSDLSFQYIKLLREQILAAKMHVPMIIVANKIDLLKVHFESSASLGENIYTPCLLHGHSQIGQKMAFRRDLALFVKKHWKECSLVECSALYNFNTLTILKEVLRFIQTRQYSQKASTVQSVHAAWQRNQCSIL